MHDERESRIRDGEARRLRHSSLELLERLLLLGCPDERLPGRRALSRALGLAQRAAELGQRRGELAEVCDESAVVAGEAQELLHLLLRRRSWPALHRCHLALHHAHSRSPDKVAEELDLLAKEAAFAELGVQLVVPQPLQHDSQMLVMLLQRATVDKNIV